MIQGRPTVCQDSTARQPSLGYRSYQPSTSLALRFSLHRGFQRISPLAHRADLKVVAQTDSHVVGTPQLAPKPSHRKSGERPDRSAPSVSRGGQPKGEKQHKTEYQPPANTKIKNWAHLLEHLKRGTQCGQCDAQHVKSVVAQLKQIAATLQPRDLAGLSQKAGRVAEATRSTDVKLLVLEILDTVVLRFNELGAQSFNVIDLTQMLSGFVYAEYKVSQKFVDGIAHALLQQQYKMQPQAWANNAWHFAKLGMNPVKGAYFDAVVEAFLMRHMPHFISQDISNILWAFATLNLTPANGRFLDSMAEAALGRLQEFEPQHISNTLWALATLNHTPANGRFLDSMAEAALSKLHEFKPQEISNTVWAFATLNHAPTNGRFLDSMAEAALGMLQEFKPQAISNIVWAFANLNHSPANGRLLDCMAEELLAKLHEFKPQAIINIVWAFATLDHVPANEHFFDAVAARVHLLSDSGEVFTVKDLSQLYQAHLVFHKLDNASCSSLRLSDDVVTQAADAFNKQRTISKSRRAVYKVLQQMGLPCMLEATLDGHVMTADIAIQGEHKIAVEIGCPYHYTSNQPFRELGSMRLRNKLLALDGWQVVMVPYFEWDNLPSRHDLVGYLQRKIEDVLS